MSDQEIETNRYARKTVTVKGLMQGTQHENAKAIMAEHGVMWDLLGHTNDIEFQTVTIKKHLIDGEELPSGLTTAETKWVIDLALKHGIDMSVVEKEISRTPGLPYGKSPVRFSMDSGWTEAKDREFEGCLVNVELDKSTRSLILTIEGKCKDDVANPGIDVWIQSTVKRVRDALYFGGFEESALEIDCEVIMGAEREAKCDPTLMRSLIGQSDEHPRLIKDGEEE